MTVIPVVIGSLGTFTKRTGTGTEVFRKKRTSENYPNHSIFTISQSTKKNLGNLRRLPVTHSIGKPSVHAALKNSQMNKIIIKPVIIIC